jgi:hypothetical protein
VDAASNDALSPAIGFTSVARLISQELYGCPHRDVGSITVSEIKTGLEPLSARTPGREIAAFRVGHL